MSLDVTRFGYLLFFYLSSLFLLFFGISIFLMLREHSLSLHDSYISTKNGIWLTSLLFIRIFFAAYIYLMGRFKPKEWGGQFWTRVSKMQSSSENCLPYEKDMLMTLRVRYCILCSKRYFLKNEAVNFDVQQRINSLVGNIRWYIFLWQTTGPKGCDD